MSDSNPDPAPTDFAWKRRGRMRLIAPTLIASLISGDPIPDLAPRSDDRSKLHTPRERTRDRQRRKRDRDRESRTLAATVEAERLEAQAERHAPSVLRNPIISPAGFMVVGARVEVIAEKPARVDPVAQMKLSERQKRAARHLLADWREVGDGLNVAAVDYLRTGGGGGGDGHDGMKAQIETRARLDGALTFLGAFAPGVARIVLDCIPLKVWAKQAGKTEADAVAWINAALTRLALFYWPPQQNGTSHERILTFGPPRASYGLSSEILLDKA